MSSVGMYIGIILVLFLLLILAFRISLFMARRAICRVITIFRDYDALQYTKAMPLEGLGLGPRPIFEFRFFRDYKPWALKTLIQSGIVRMAEESTFYLSEDTLDANPNIATACHINKIKTQNNFR